jgi:hypothetical protein
VDLLIRVRAREEPDIGADDLIKHEGRRGGGARLRTRRRRPAQKLDLDGL